MGPFDETTNAAGAHTAASLAATGLGLWELDAARGTLRWSATARAAYGLSGDSDAIPLDALLERLHPDDREATRIALRAAAEPDALPLALEHRTRTEPGLPERAFLMRGSRREDGTLVGVTLDVSELRRARDEQRLLARLAEEIAEAREPHETLERVARLLVPFVADWCIVHLANEDGTPQLAAVAHRDASLVALRCDAERRYPMSAGARASHVMRTGTPHLESASDLDRHDTGDARQRALRDRFGETAAVTVALRARGRTLGTIGFAMAESGRPLGETDVRFALEVAARMAVAVDNAQLLAEARAARAAAESANVAKSQFLTTISHEIRTPINAVLGFSELLGMELDGPLTPRQREHLHRIDACGQQLASLVEEVLDLAKLETGHMPLLREAGTLADAARHALSLVRRRAAACSIEIDVAAEECASDYVGDANRVRQIVGNLLSNAVKFSPPGARVRIRSGVAPRASLGAGAESATEPVSYLRVEDNGVGIAPEKLEAIFEPFVQAEGGHTRRWGGTGLGLALSRRFARLMGGDIIAESTPGVGSAFTLWLPRAESASRPGRSTDRRSPARTARGLARGGALLLARVDSLVHAHVRAMRADATTLRACALSDAEAEDHVAALVADLAQSLVLMAEAEGGPSDGLRSATAIQRLIAERHGAQRYRQGFTEEALVHEFRLLGDAIVHTLRVTTRQSPTGNGRLADLPPDAAAAALDLLARAERASLRGYRQLAVQHDAPARVGPYRGGDMAVVRAVAREVPPRRAAGTDDVRDARGN